MCLRTVGVGDVGAAALCEAPTTNTVLTWLDLNTNSITGVDTAALAEAAIPWYTG